MTNNQFMNYLGLLLTIISLVIAIVQIKKQKNKARLALVKHFTLNMFNNICKNFSNISLYYNGNPIKENVVYFKASLVNNGWIPVESKEGLTRIILELEPSYHWLDVRISRKSDGLNIEPTISTHHLEFNFNFLNENDFFQFESLIEPQAEICEPKEIVDKLKVKYRIINTKHIEIMSLSFNDEQMINYINDYDSFISRFQRFIIWFGPILMFIYLYFNWSDLKAESSKMTSAETRLFTFLFLSGGLLVLYSYFILYLNGYFRQFKKYKLCKILTTN